MPLFDSDFTAEQFSSSGIEHTVFIGGSGPPLILMHEMDGLGKACIALAERLAEDFTVHVPLLFAKPRVHSIPGALQGFAYLCVRREFYAFVTGRTSPVTQWITSMARAARLRDPEHRKVSLIGMCMTGGIALAALAHDDIAAGVAAQPSLPFAVFPFSTDRRRSDLGMSAGDLARGVASNKPVLTLRFERDRMCPLERIEIVGETYEGPDPEIVPGKGHPTLTQHYRKRKGHPGSAAAINQAIEFLKNQYQA